MKHSLYVKLTLVSEANNREFWKKKSDRSIKHKNGVKLVWLSKRPKVKVPCTVTLIRIGPKYLDDDNLAYAFKSIRDQVGSLILPHKALGQADGRGTGISWAYGQEIGPYGIRIEIEDTQGEPNG